MTACSYDGCNTEAVRLGVCADHLAAHKRKLAADPAARCGMDKCHRQLRRKGMCAFHYALHLRTIRADNYALTARQEAETRVLDINLCLNGAAIRKLTVAAEHTGRTLEHMASEIVQAWCRQRYEEEEFRIRSTPEIEVWARRENQTEMA